MTRRRWVTLGATGVVVALILPFLWWRLFGPTRIEGLELGAAPSEGLPAEDVANHPSGVGGQPLAADGAAAAPAIELPPLTISPTTSVTVVASLGSAGMSRADAQRLRVADVDDRGGDRLTDSILLLISDASTRSAALLSLPRDLWLSSRGHRINETLVRHGTQAFIDDVSRVSGLPVHHLVQVNFTAFADLVDGVGGVAVEVDQPLADLHAALYVPGPGCWRLDGAAALAYARSRMTLTSRDEGETWRSAASASDFGRMRRQQALLAAAWDQVRGPGLVRDLPDLVRLADGLTVDASLGLGDLRDLARAFQDVAAGRIEGHVLPTVERRAGRARVLAIDYGRALPLYERLRSWPPTSGTAAGSPQGDAAPSPSPSPSAGPGPESSPAPPASPDASPTAEERRAAPVPTSGCDRGSARRLPDPGPALAAIARGERPPPDTGEGDPDGTPSPTPEPSPSPGPSPSPAPSPSPDDDGSGLVDDLPTPP